MKNVMIMAGANVGKVWRVSDKEAKKMVDRKEAVFAPKEGSFVLAHRGTPEPSQVHSSHPRVRKALGGEYKKKGK